MYVRLWGPFAPFRVFRGYLDPLMFRRSLAGLMSA